MKKISILIILCLTVFLEGCKKNEPSKTSTIELSQDTVLISDQGTSVIIRYRVNGENNNDNLSASWEQEWLTINVQTTGNIEFSASINSEYTERQADVTFSYPGAEPITMVVIQSGKEKPLRLEMVDVSSTEIHFSGYTTDPQMTWIPMIAHSEYFDYVTSDEQLFSEDMEYFSYFAELQGLTIEQFLMEMLETGSVDNRTIDGLEPSTEYVLYAYGLTPEGVPTTDVVKLPFTTEPQYEGDITFEFDFQVNDFILEYTITPSHSGVPFYFGIIDKPTLNSWYETYQTEDLSVAIQYGDIEATIQLLLEYELINSRSSYFEIFNNTSKIEDGYYECFAATDYIIYAAKWNEECSLIGEVSFCEFSTPEIEGTELSIDVEILDITQSNVTVLATPSNNDDSYVIIPEKSEEISGMNDSEIFDYILRHYDSFLSEYTYIGNKERKFSRLSSDTDYTLLAFGYKAGSLTSSEIYKTPFRTLESGAPEDCTFEITVEPGSDMADVTIIPSDKGHYYHWMAYTPDYTEEQAKAYLRDVVINQYYEGNFPAFASWELSIGDTQSQAWDLWPSCEYKIGVIIMDYQTGEFLSDMFFSETFTTEEAYYADIDITVNIGPYYDLQELVDAGYTEYEDSIGEGDAIMDVNVVIEGEYSEFYYDIFNKDLTDVETYPDEIFYQDLYYGKTFESTTFLLPYDTQMTIVAVALDKNYNYSRLYRHTFILSKDGASDVGNFGQNSVKLSTITSTEKENVRVRRDLKLSKEEISDKNFTSIMNCPKASYRENMKLENARKRLENRKK